MPNEILILDAASSSIDGTSPGSPLNIGPGTLFGLREFAAPAPSQTVQYAGTVDTEGSLPGARKHENRVLSMKITCATQAALRSLQEKVAKIAMEGGTLKWTLPTADTVIFDLHTADTFEPTFDVTWQKNGGAYCDVNLAFSAKPYGRGAEITLSDHIETALPVLIFTETTIKGDIPGLGRLVIDEDQAQTQRTVLWGLQSRYYDSAAAAGLYFEAEACNASNAVLTAGPAGASGAGSNTMKDSALQIASYDAGPQFDLTLRKHVGAFRVIVRAQAPVTNTGTVSARLKLFVRSDPIVYNDPVSIDVTTEGSWVLLDLGQMSITPAKAGAHSVDMEIQAVSTVAGDDVFWDWIAFLPISEGSGQADSGLTGATVMPAMAASGHLQVASDHVLAFDATNLYGRPNGYQGDYLLVPPARPEARTVRFFVKASRGRLLPTALDSLADAGIDDISARLSYTPRYLVIPLP